MSDTEQLGGEQRATPEHDTESDRAGTTAERRETTPTLRPTIVWLVTVVVVGTGLIAYLSLRREQFADPQVVSILIQVTGVLTLIGAVRFLIRLYVLKRTRYVIDPTSVTRRYDLLLRSRRREVPFSMVRSHELRQSRIQKLLGYGTITLNEGLGPMELENVPDPFRLYDAVQRHARDVNNETSVDSPTNTAPTPVDD